MTRDDALAELSVLLGFPVRDVIRRPLPPESLCDVHGRRVTGQRWTLFGSGRAADVTSEVVRRPSLLDAWRTRFVADGPRLSSRQCRRVLALMHEVHENTERSIPTVEV